MQSKLGVPVLPAVPLQIALYLTELMERATSFPGSLFSASLSRWNRDPGCGWSSDHLSIQNRRVGVYSSAFSREENPVVPPFQQIFLPRDQPQPGSLFQRLRD